MEIVTIFLVISCFLVTSVLLLTNGYFVGKKDNTHFFEDNIFDNNYDYKNNDSSSLRLLRKPVFSDGRNYHGPNTKCFSCEKQMLNGREYSSRPTKCFSCEKQLGSLGNPTARHPRHRNLSLLPTNAAQHRCDKRPMQRQAEKSHQSVWLLQHGQRL